MVFRHEMLDHKNMLTHKQLVNELELELLRIHRDEVASNTISVYRSYENTAAPRGAKAATHPPVQPMQNDAKPAEPEACRNFQMGKCRRGDDCRYTHTGAQPKWAVAAAAPTQAVLANPTLCTHEVVKTGTCPRKAECRFSHD